MAAPPEKSPYSLRTMYSPRAAFQRKVVRESRKGSQAWLAVAAGLYVLNRLRRAVSRQEEVASLDLLRPGQGLIITTIARPSRRQRKRSQRAARAGGG